MPVYAPAASASETSLAEPEGMTDAEIAADDASGRGLDEIDVSPEDMPVYAPAASAPEPSPAESEALHEPGESVLSEVLLSGEASLSSVPDLSGMPAEPSADAALLGLDLDESGDESVDVDALLDQIGDEDIHAALVGAETEPGADAPEHILTLVEERVGVLTAELRETLRAELAAEIKTLVEQAVPREAARIIREEIAALTRELAAGED